MTSIMDPFDLAGFEETDPIMLPQDAPQLPAPCVGPFWADPEDPIMPATVDDRDIDNAMLFLDEKQLLELDCPDPSCDVSADDNVATHVPTGYPARLISRPAGPDDTIWNDFRSEIVNIYMNEDKRLPDLMQIMKSQFGFCAT